MWFPVCIDMVIVFYQEFKWTCPVHADIMIKKRVGLTTTLKVFLLLSVPFQRYVIPITILLFGLFLDGWQTPEGNVLQHSG